MTLVYAKNISSPGDNVAKKEGSPNQVLLVFRSGELY
jgi:hypothetical protein